MKQFFVKLCSDKLFRCSVGILLCTLISGIVNPVWRILAPYMHDSHMDFVIPFVHISMIVCSVIFFTPAWNAVKYSYMGETGEPFQECMKSVMVIANIIAVVSICIGGVLAIITIMLFFGTALLVTLTFFAICGVNAILAKNALDTIKNQQ